MTLFDTSSNVLLKWGQCEWRTFEGRLLFIPKACLRPTLPNSTTASTSTSLEIRFPSRALTHKLETIGPTWFSHRTFRTKVQWQRNTMNPSCLREFLGWRDYQWFAKSLKILLPSKRRATAPLVWYLKCLVVLLCCCIRALIARTYVSLNLGWCNQRDWPHVYLFFCLLWQQSSFEVDLMSMQEKAWWSVGSNPICKRFQGEIDLFLHMILLKYIEWRKLAKIA